MARARAIVRRITNQPDTPTAMTETPSEKPTPLATALAEKEMSIADLARALGTSRQNVSRWANGIVGIKPDIARQIASILTVSAESLVMRDPGLRLDAIQKPTYVYLRGTIAAGVWLEHDEAPQLSDTLPIVGGRWSSLEQYAFRVSGPSVDKLRIYDGDYVICVPYFDARRVPTQNDVVVVERRRGATIERTVKQLAITHNGCELWPRSSDARFQSPLSVNQVGEGEEPDGTTVEITGLVIWRGGEV